MNGVRRFLATATSVTVLATSQAPPPPPEQGPVPVESATSWMPQPAAKPLASRDSSSSTTRPIDRPASTTSSTSRSSTPDNATTRLSRTTPTTSSLLARVTTATDDSSDPRQVQEYGTSRDRMSPNSQSRSGRSFSSKPSPLQPFSPPFSPAPVWKSTAAAVNPRDELLMMLLTSQAILDSREFEILSAEDVDELKSQHATLLKRVSGLKKRLQLESKIRDAAQSLARLGPPPARRASKPTTPSKPSPAEQLETANAKVDAVQRELFRAMEQATDIHRRILEHRAAVLAFTVRNVEKPSSYAVDSEGSDSGTANTTFSGELSPVSTAATSVSNTMTSRSKFEGPHFFAGHAEAVVPEVPRSPPSWRDLEKLQQQLVEATQAATAAKRQASEYQRELALLGLEKNELETKLELDLQTSAETIASLEADLKRMSGLGREMELLSQQRDSIETERQQLQETLRAREGDLMALRASNASTGASSSAEIQARDAELQSVRQRWESEVAALRVELTTSAAREKEILAELEVGRESVLDLASTLRVTLPLRTTTIPAVTAVLGVHAGLIATKLEAAESDKLAWDEEKRALEADVRRGTEARERLLSDIEQARQEREEYRRQSEAHRSESQALDAQLRERLATPAPAVQPLSLDTNALREEHERMISPLKELWSSLPSIEARGKIPGMKSPPTGTPKSPRFGSSSSISELDVRALKTLYDPRNAAYRGISPSVGEFSIPSFVERVQALLADDRALIERLVRFAQGHELLKTNAERAQKLAQESSLGLETYQKQVNTLEERNQALVMQQATLLDDVNQLQEALEVSLRQKQELEAQAIKQASAIKDLQEANDTLSARALTLAAEAAEAVSRPPSSIQKDKGSETKIASLVAELDDAKDELDRIRAAESTQRIQLLDELNTMQTENANLRSQLRAEQRKNSK